jgi:hypothetical protein
MSGRGTMNPYSSVSGSALETRRLKAVESYTARLWLAESKLARPMCHG